VKVTSQELAVAIFDLGQAGRIDTRIHDWLQRVRQQMAQTGVVHADLRANVPPDDEVAPPPAVIG
jgi:hypothetical protein